MIRVVLDTNIIISALLNPVGLPAQIFLLALQESSVQPCISGAIFAEYEEALRRPRLARTAAQIESALTGIRTRALWVRPKRTLQICSDPDDNIFLECAEAAEADYLITGNIADFPPTWDRTLIVTCRQFMESIA